MTVDEPHREGRGRGPLTPKQKIYFQKHELQRTTCNASIYVLYILAISFLLRVYHILYTISNYSVYFLEAATNEPST